MRLVVDDSDHVWEAWLLNGRPTARSVVPTARASEWCTVTFSSPMHGLRKGKLRGNFADATDDDLKDCLRFAVPQR